MRCPRVRPKSPYPTPISQIHETVGKINLIWGSRLVLSKTPSTDFAQGFEFHRPRLRMDHRFVESAIYAIPQTEVSAVYHPNEVALPDVETGTA